MKLPPDPKSSQSSSSSRWRKLECDEEEAAFDDKLRQIARHKPEPKKKGGKQNSDGG